jgi:hypothetical protein
MEESYGFFRLFHRLRFRFLVERARVRQLAA